MYYYVGQKVSHQEYGNGVVTKIEHSFSCPVVVLFDSGEEMSFTIDGKYSPLGQYPSLSQQPHVPLELKEITVFESGELVWVKRFNDDTWNARYYHKGDKLYWCFDNQKKEGGVSYWNEIRKFSDIPF